MSLIRFAPASFVSQLQDEINRWVPPVDITEYADRFELAVDLPGVEPEKVEITLEDGVLSLSGERTAAPERAGEADAQVRTRTERGHGRFFRRFVLPETVDAERVKATGRHGVLAITIPKQAKAQPRRIQVAA